MLQHRPCFRGSLNDIIMSYAFFPDMGQRVAVYHEVAPKDHCIMFAPCRFLSCFLERKILKAFSSNGDENTGARGSL